MPITVNAGEGNGVGVKIAVGGAWVGVREGGRSVPLGGTAVGDASGAFSCGAVAASRVGSTVEVQAGISIIRTRSIKLQARGMLGDEKRRGENRFIL
jgi:hypothetical protein